MRQVLAKKIYRLCKTTLEQEAKEKKMRPDYSRLKSIYRGVKKDWIARHNQKPIDITRFQPKGKKHRIKNQLLTARKAA